MIPKFNCRPVPDGSSVSKQAYRVICLIRLAASANGAEDKHRMSSYFRRQLADYVEYHRDPLNCAMHVFGIVFLFLAAILPLSLWPITVFGIQTSAAAIAVIPVLVYWFLLDFALGAGILAAAVVLLATAAVMVDHTTIAGMWSLTAILIVVGVASQIIGHRVFEGRQPALVDNPTHLLLGPMFVMAKLFIALGFRRDLATIIQGQPQSAAS
ncbi:MAG TPA: Mpo1-like protein [Bradyrhizobium sp.]|nr:Mpo1-like protein [Bradyrhizobium sp.]